MEAFARSLFSSMRDRVARRKRKDTTAGVACVASVSNRVIARKLERKQKKKKVDALVPAF